MKEMPEAGQVYVSRELDEHGAKWRRVIQVFHGRVFYSIGTDVNRDCSVETFKRFMAKAELQGVVVA